MSTLTPHGILHKVLFQFGYRRDPSNNGRYQQDIDINGIIFPVRILLHDPDFQVLPTVYLSHLPEQLPDRLPHVLKHLKLCYIDESRVHFDPFEIEDNISLVLNLVEKLLGDFVSNPELLQEEIKREVIYYWDSDIYNCCYILSNGKKLSHALFKRPSLNDNEDIHEIVLGKDTELDQWIEKRNGHSKHKGNAISIALSDGIKIPETSWPPENILDAIEWLNSSGDKHSAHILIDFVLESLAESSSYLAVLKLGSSHLGIYASGTFTTQTRLIRNLIARKNKKSGKSHKINHDQKLKFIKRSFHLGKPTFFRVKVDNSTPEHVSTRNISQTKNLKGTNIALIGCGTIGGYAAQMLVQSGAGTDTGIFDIFDPDTLLPDNLGRHILGIKYIGENKALSMTDWLQSNSVTKLSITPYPNRITPNLLIDTKNKYDLIIDATGDSKFSTLLSHLMKRSDKSLPIIYGWVDALGLASRGLIDDSKHGHACYYCVTKIDKTTGTQKNLFKKGAKIPKWMPNACGIGSYLPFSSQASVCAASLIQGLCLDWINGNPSPRFRHITIDHNNVVNRNSNNMTSRQDCPCCSFSRV